MFDTSVEIVKSVKLKSWILIPLTLISLSGCAMKDVKDLNVFRDRSNDYQNTKVYPVLEKSECKRADSCSDMYQIP